MKKTILEKGIPVSVSLGESLENQNIRLKVTNDKKRIVFISALAVFVGALISVIAKLLVNLINLITNISFHGDFSVAYQSPATNTLGWWVIIIPAVGGVVVGLMALYGSKAIRGHGIPQAQLSLLLLL